MSYRLIILEGPDKVGKSTVADGLCERLGARKVIQPSEFNHVGWLRQVVKTTQGFSPLERQLLHTVSHVVDAYTMFGGEQNIVMDRCYISALVYGERLGLNGLGLDLLKRIHLDVYSRALKNYDVEIVFLYRYLPLAEKDGGDVYEDLDWHNLRDTYATFFKVNTGETFIKSDEKKRFVDLSNLNQTESLNKVLEAIS